MKVEGKLEQVRNPDILSGCSVRDGKHRVEVQFQEAHVGIQNGNLFCSKIVMEYIKKLQCIDKWRIVTMIEELPYIKSAINFFL